MSEVIDLPTQFEVVPLREHALGGGIEGAQRNTREMSTWMPDLSPPDLMVNPVKQIADGRARDVVQNDGYMMGAVNTHRDSIVGSQYRLNAAPNWKVLGFTEAWAEEFQLAVEARFNLTADSPSAWLHAGGTLTLTGMVRLAVAQFLITGEVLGTAEWKRAVGRPCATAFQFVSPDRLTNPDFQMDGRYLRRGVVLDEWGAPTDYWFRNSHPYDFTDMGFTNWSKVPRVKPWGRMQVLHIVDNIQPDQTRGISDMVSVMKEIKMAKTFKEVTLQNAVINASYAAALESELPPEMIAQAMGSAGTPAAGMNQTFGAYLEMASAYLSQAGNIKIDGSSIPMLMPNTKLKMQPMGTPGGIGTTFEESLMRYIGAPLGMSYEQFSKDYSKVNYSSARAGANEAFKFMQSRKKVVADRTATEIYWLWLEEELSAGTLPMPRGWKKADFYLPLFKEAIGQCSWIGASRGQIDELKETQSAMMRIKSGLSTYEIESARLGNDFRDVFKQLQREEAMAKEMGLSFTLDASKPGANEAQKTVRGDKNNDAVTTDTEDDEL